MTTCFKIDISIDFIMKDNKYRWNSDFVHLHIYILQKKNIFGSTITDIVHTFRILYNWKFNFHKRKSLQK